jgi:two-component system phosphate regulon sensor histidine kinase PhoR
MSPSESWFAASVAALAAAITGLVAGVMGAGPVPASLAAGVAGLAVAALVAHLSRFPVRGAGGSGTDRSAPLAAPGTAGQELLDKLPIPLVLLNRSRMLHFANATARDLFGPVARGEALSSIIRSPRLAEAVAAVAGGGASRSVEFTHMRAREQRVLLAHVGPVDLAARTGAAIMIVIEDHTRLARIERMRSDFIANASHELKTPLAAITGFIETLQGTAANDGEARARFLPIMAREAERMARLVEDLLSLNRIEMNEHLRPEGKVALGELLHETAAAVAPLARAAEVRIEVAVERPGPEVPGSRDELNQLFVNLIDNAIKYGGSGGVVRIAPAPPEPGRGRMTGITVTDRGPGIERQHIPRLTERFYRIPAARGGPKGGTGLGLTIVRHILNRHRGDLTIQSAPGEGASFTAWLPQGDDSAPEPPH